MLIDRIIFVLTVIVGVVYLYATTQLPTLEIGDPLGPKAFPMLLGIGLLLAAAMLAFEMWRDRSKGSPSVTAPSPFDAKVVAALAAVAVWTGAYYLAFVPLGYVLATTIYLLPLTAAFNQRKWVANILSSVVFAGFTYWLFVKLDVSLPKGVMPF